MKLTTIKLVLLILIGTLCFQLSSCSTPQKYFPVDASLIKKDMSRDEVKKLVGIPDAVTVNQEGDEEWFYYNDITHFWDKLPFIGGGREIETLMITFHDSKVKKWIYYVNKL